MRILSQIMSVKAQSPEVKLPVSRTLRSTSSYVDLDMSPLLSTAPAPPWAKYLHAAQHESRILTAFNKVYAAAAKSQTDSVCNPSGCSFLSVNAGHQVTWN